MVSGGYFVSFFLVVITSSSSAVTENSNVTKLDLKTQLHTNQRSSGIDLYTHAQQNV